MPSQLVAVAQVTNLQTLELLVVLVVLRGVGLLQLHLALLVQVER
jgi:hypothetical protein